MCFALAAVLMAGTLLSVSSCSGTSARADEQRKVLTFGLATTIPLPAPSKEAMCFDRLETSIVKRNQMLWSLMECGRALEFVLEELASCRADQPREFHVMPYSPPQATPGDPQTAFVF